MTNGRLGGKIFGHRILKLTATGRKSGKLRDILIYTFPYNEGYVIIGSNAGSDKHPSWYLNLLANPEASIQVGTMRIAVQAREAEGEERELLWSEITAVDTSFLEYQKQTDRRIPVVILEPVPD